MKKLITQIIFISFLFGCTSQVKSGLNLTGLKEGREMPLAMSFNGGNVSPKLSWSNINPAAKSLVIICRDTDAGGFVHWGIYNIDPVRQGIESGVPKLQYVESLGFQVKNSFGNFGWDGPAPPSGRHRYVFTLYSLKELIKSEQVKDNVYILESLMKDLILDEFSFAMVFSARN